METNDIKYDNKIKSDKIKLTLDKNKSKKSKNLIILNAFEYYNKEILSTNDIVKYVFSNEENYDLLNYKDKARLNRVILYYLNNLVNNGKLELYSVKNKLKYFRIILNKKQIFYKYYNNGIIFTRNKINKFNSIVIDYYNLDKIFYLIKKIDDVIAINNFQDILNKSENDVKNIIEYLNNISSLYNISFSLIFDLNTTINNLNNISQSSESISNEFIKSKNNLENIKKKIRIIILKLEPQNNIVFETNIKNTINFPNLFKEILLSDSNNINSNIFFRNSDLSINKFFFGKRGPYVVNEDIKRDLVYLNTKSNYVIDVEKYLSFKNKINNLHKLIIAIANQIIRNRNFNLNLNNKITYDYNFYDSIRFWNYGWKNKDINTEQWIDVLNDIVKRLKEFIKIENRIYYLSGIPLNLNIKLSSFVNKSKNKKISIKRNQRIIINSKYDFDFYKEIFKYKEIIFNKFDGGDFMRIYTYLKNKDIYDVFFMLIRSFFIPFFSIVKINKNKNLLNYI